MIWGRYERALEADRDFWRNRAMELEDRLADVRRECDEQIAAARTREQEIFDKALRRHGSTPVIREAPPPIPPSIPTAEEVAYAEDWVAEYLEVFPTASVHEAAQRFEAYREGLYDPKNDPRVPSDLR